MNEIKRPASVRELIDHLPRASLVNLCELRGLAVSRANDDCRSSISRSYRGQRDELLQALRKEDLVTLLRLPIRHRNALFDLPNPHTYSKSELTTLAVRAFGRLDELFAPFVERAPKGGPLVQPVGPAEPVRPSPPEAPAEAAPPSIGGRGWSRLQPLSALFVKLGREAPTVLEQDAFGELIEELELRGFEVADESGSILTPLHDVLALHAEVRIRHDAHAGPTVLDLGRGRTELPRAPVPELSDYARASLRLELLTCGLPREPDESAIAAVVELATAGTAIEAGQRALLATVAKSVASVPRSAFSVLTALHAKLDQEDVEILLRDLASVGASWRAAIELGEHWAALHGRTAPGAATEPTRVIRAVSTVALAMMPSANLSHAALATAVAANWEALPHDLSTYDLETFAHMINGYDVAEAHLGSNPFDVRNQLDERHRATGVWKGTTIELLVALFAEVRGWRGYEEGPNDGDEAHTRALELYRALANQLRRQPDDVRFIPAPPRDSQE